MYLDKYTTALILGYYTLDEGNTDSYILCFNGQLSLLDGIELINMINKINEPDQNGRYFIKEMREFYRSVNLDNIYEELNEIHEDITDEFGHYGYDIDKIKFIDGIIYKNLKF